MCALSSPAVGTVCVYYHAVTPAHLVDDFIWCWGSNLGLVHSRWDSSHGASLALDVALVPVPWYLVECWFKWALSGLQRALGFDCFAKGP